jgi:hypothetical protein
LWQNTDRQLVFSVLLSRTTKTPANFFGRVFSCVQKECGGRAKLPLPFCHGAIQTAVQGHFSIEGAADGRNLFFV